MSGSATRPRSAPRYDYAVAIDADRLDSTAEAQAPRAAAVCAACGSALLPGPILSGPDRMLGTPGAFEVQECERCGSGLTFPLVSISELGAFYGGSYAPYTPAAGRVQRIVSALVQRVQGWRALGKQPFAPLRTLEPGRALDVGCGRGDFGYQLITRGWQVTGVDPSAAACQVARQRGLDARPGTVQNVELEPESYDAAILQHSLEHVPEPANDLRRVHTALRKNGLLVMVMPNFGSWQRKRFGSRWFHLDLPRHRVHFTRAGLSKVLERSGFETMELETTTTSVGLPASIQYVLFGRCVFPGGLSQRIAVGACIVLFPVIWMLDRFLGGGDVLTVVARKTGSVGS